MRRIEAKARGRTLACHTVTDGKQPLGVFAYVLRADGYAEVLFSYARAGRYDFVLSALVTDAAARGRSEEHTSELQSLMRTSYAVFCLKKQKQHKNSSLTFQPYTKSRRTK